MDTHFFSLFLGAFNEYAISNIEKNGDRPVPILKSLVSLHKSSLLSAW